MDLERGETADLELQTEPFGASVVAEEEATPGGAIVIDEKTADLALRGQLAQQLSLSDSAFEALPRARAPRSTMDLDDEVTNIVARPSSKPV